MLMKSQLSAIGLAAGIVQVIPVQPPWPNPTISFIVLVLFFGLIDHALIFGTRLWRGGLLYFNPEGAMERGTAEETLGPRKAVC